MARVPYPPYQDRPINPYMKLNNGVSYGLLAPNGTTVDHSMYGILSGTDAWFRRRDIGSLTPWGIGGAADGRLDGVIYRWMDYYAFEGIQPWSSGPWRAPGYGDGPGFVAKYTVAGINGVAEAIETSDGGANQYPMTQKQWTSLIWLKAAIAHRGGITSDTFRSLFAFMHHREFTQPAYKDCPFPRIYNFTAQYLDAVVALMRFFEGKTDDLNTLVFRIGGLVIDLRHVGRMRDNLPTPPAPTPAPAPAPIKDWVAGASVRAKKEIIARQSPSTSGAFGMLIRGGEFAKLVDGKPREGNGMVWMDVLTVNGTGWVPQQDIELASKETTAPGPIFQDFTPNRTFTVGKGGATLRQWASTDSEILVMRIAPGTKIEADGYYFGEEVDGDNRWIVQNDDPRGRIHAGALVESI